MKEAELQTNRLQALAESSQMFAEASRDLGRLLGLVARRFSELIGDATNIRLIEGDALVPVATYHPDREVNGYLREYHDATPLKVGVGISGRVLETGEPYFEPHLDLEQLKQRVAPGFVPIFEKIGITGMIVVRLRARGINLGYLALFRISTAHAPYTLDDLRLVQDLADRAALAIDTSQLVDGLERRVAERTVALETANRELEAFAFSVSHDLQSPLRSIDGFSRILEEDYGARLDDEGRRLLAVVRRNAQHMGTLIDHLLRLSRLGHGAIQPVEQTDMRELVEKVLAEVRAAHPNVKVDARIGDLPLAVCNPQLMRQVWANLLDNAVKYSGKKPVAQLEVCGQRQNGELRYTVTDHGAGFDPQNASKLFGVFQRLHHASDFQGNGVGLALVQRIVTRHGGRVWAEGRLDDGATFGFGLPENGPGQLPRPGKP
ncbi:MAG: GAF domain-containing protein [Archangiaceae bacterium]|nr:GAF domain-containing protein [Archangiaceae bacterium]